MEGTEVVVIVFVLAIGALSILKKLAISAFFLFFPEAINKGMLPIIDAPAITKSTSGPVLSQFEPDQAAAPTPKATPPPNNTQAVVFCFLLFSR